MPWSFISEFEVNIIFSLTFVFSRIRCSNSICIRAQGPQYGLQILTIEFIAEEFPKSIPKSSQPSVIGLLRTKIALKISGLLFNRFTSDALEGYFIALIRTGLIVFQNNIGIKMLAPATKI